MILFPTTTEAFIAYQEAGTGRKLEGFERDLAAVIVESICWWCDRAYQAGKETAQHEAD